MKQDFRRGEALFECLAALPDAMIEEADRYTAAEKDAKIRRCAALAAAFLLCIGLGTVLHTRQETPDTPNHGANSQGYFNAQVLSVEGGTVLVQVTEGFDAAKAGDVIELDRGTVSPSGNADTMGLTAGEEVRVVFHTATLTEENGAMRIGTVFSLYRVVDGVIVPHGTAFPPAGTEGLSPDELPDAAYDTTPDEPRPDAPVISLADVTFNEVSELLSAAIRYYDPDEYTQKKWHAVELEAYYRHALVPPYTPAGFLRVGDVAAQVTLENDTGTVVHDTVHLTWKGDNEATYTVSYSKRGLLSCAVYATDGNEVTTDIGGIPVVFGCCPMVDGPSHIVMQPPTSRCHVYTAYFTVDGTRYEIVTHRMDPAEIVRLAASVIYGKICGVGD